MKILYVTYGDGPSNIDIDRLNEFHKKHRKIASLSAVRPPARFGELFIKKEVVSEFKEKPQTSENWINGGFFVFNKEIFDYLK